MTTYLSLSQEQAGVWAQVTYALDLGEAICVEGFEQPISKPGNLASQIRPHGQSSVSSFCTKINIFLQADHQPCKKSDGVECMV